MRCFVIVVNADLGQAILFTEPIEQKYIMVSW